MSRREAAKEGGQLGFALLLGFCLFQTVWWVYDSRVYSIEVRARAQRALEHDQQQAQRLLKAGVPPSEVNGMFSGLTVTPDGETPLLPEVVAALDQARDRRIRRYTWEGGFFLVVFAAGMWVLSRTIRQYAELQRRQANFVAAVSHELKTPLASLRLAAESLQGRDLPPKRRDKLVGRVLAGADRLEAMVSKVLQTRWVEAAGREAKPEPVVLAEHVAACVELLDLAGKQLEVEVEVPSDLVAYADPLGVDTVLQNVLGNAVKAMDQAAERRLTIRGARAGKGKIAVTIRDTGVGFDPGEAERIFEKFYRVGDELRRTSRGTGLGLYLTRRVVELDGGTVTATSDGPGSGAELEIVWRTPPPGKEAA